MIAMRMSAHAAMIDESTMRPKESKAIAVNITTEPYHFTIGNQYDRQVFENRVHRNRKVLQTIYIRKRVCFNLLDIRF